jgi:hypothetical protein
VVERRTSACQMRIGLQNQHTTLKKQQYFSLTIDIGKYKGEKKKMEKKNENREGDMI